jgi:hypothetical protein
MYFLCIFLLSSTRASFIDCKSDEKFSTYSRWSIPMKKTESWISRVVASGQPPVQATSHASSTVDHSNWPNRPIPGIQPRVAQTDAIRFSPTFHGIPSGAAQAV